LKPSAAFDAAAISQERRALDDKRHIPACDRFMNQAANFAAFLFPFLA